LNSPVITPMHDDFRQQAYDYIYKRSIILAQDAQIIAFLADDLRNGATLPRNQRDFEEFAERYVRAKLPIGQMDEAQIHDMVRYYALIGSTNQSGGLLRGVAILLALGLLIAVIAGIAQTLANTTDPEQINTATTAGRTILIVGVVLGLYYWVWWKIHAALAVVRITLLLVLIIALVWLLYDNNIIELTMLTENL